MSSETSENAQKSISHDMEKLKGMLENLRIVDTPTTKSSTPGFSVELNDIRTILKNIGTYQAQIPGNHAETLKLIEILKHPLNQFKNGSKSPSGNETDDLFSILSFFKLLAEINLPENGTIPEEDIFWKSTILPVCVDILRFLNVHIFQRSFTSLSASPSDTSVETIQHGFAYHQQLGILKKGTSLLLIFLKRAISYSNIEFQTEELSQSILQMLPELCKLMEPEDTCRDFDIGLDIRCNIGVVICYSLYNLHHPNKDKVHSYINSLFSSTSSQVKTGKSEMEVIEGNISKIIYSDVNRIGLAYGVLNMCFEHDHDQDLYFSVGKNLLDIQHGVKEAVSLGAARTLEIWTLKLSRVCVPTPVLKHVSSLFRRVELFCFMYMPGHIDAIKNCCRNTLSHLSRIYDRLDDEKIACSETGTWTSALLSTILGHPDHIKWLALSCVVKITKKSFQVLKFDAKLPDDLLCVQRTFKHAANDTYVALMSYHFHSPSEYQKDWESTWMEPLFSVQLYSNECSWAQKKNIISLILNSEKMRLTHLQPMIKPLLKSVVRRMNDKQKGESNRLPEASLLAAETIKMAYEFKITIDSQELNLVNFSGAESKEPQNTFKGLVPRSVLHNWLWSENQQIRLAGFALLVEAKKTSELIPKEDFESLKIGLKYNLLSQNPAFRQQFVSYFKKLVKRLKDGENFARRKRDIQTVQRYEEFLCFLWKFLTEDEGLFHGANFGRRCQALECLSELTQTFTDFHVFGIKESEAVQYLRWLIDTYENNKTHALEVLARMNVGNEFEDDKFCASLYNDAVKLCKSVKPPDSVTGRYLMTLLMRKCSKNGSYTAWEILQLLYSEVEKMYTQTITTSLVKVSSETPLYGCVRCIRMILENTNDYKDPENCTKYREYFAKLLKLCFQIDELLFPILGSAAPEGFLPELQGPQVVRSLASQMLLVNSWRTMTQNSLLMADMCSMFVLEGEVRKQSGEYLLTYQQVCEIGEHLLFLLSNLVHRGVFEQVFVGFKTFANRVGKSSCHQYNQLPEKWLQNAMDKDHISAKSITRRSAGLPFIFQALLSVESDNEAFFKKWLDRLFNLDYSPEMTTTRIHSTNIIRGLFRDANFSAAMMPYVPHGLNMAFSGLKSADWTERNSGLMLYGAVMRRSFGPKLNLMNAPTFFRKFPQMYDFLLTEIDNCISYMNKKMSRKSESEQVNEEPLTYDFTFHLLLLLSSFTACGRLEDTHFKLSEFIPRLRKCGESNDMEVRKLAAKALIPFLVSPEDRRELARSLLNDILLEKECHNKFHGILLQFLHVAIHFSTDGTQSTYANEEIVSIFVSQIIPYLTSEKFSLKSPSLYETVLEVMIVLHNFKSLKRGEMYRAVDTVQTFFYKSYPKFENRYFTPGLLVADKIIANAVIRISFEDLDKDKFFELVYNYFSKSSRYGVYVDQFLELNLENPDLLSVFSQVCDEIGVVIEAILESYMTNISTTFDKFPATKLELNYLTFIQQIPVEMFESCCVEKEVMSFTMIQRLFKLCGESVATTVQIKSAALMVLGKIAFCTNVRLTEEIQTVLCDMLIENSVPGVDDDLRLAVVECIPVVPFKNMRNFSGLNQAKIWSSIFLLAQDDESFIRQIIIRKLTSADGPYCDRKALEVLTNLYFHNFLAYYPTDGLLVLIGLLLRENLQVEAKAADDESEDRLFDSSEMNMYFEHRTLAKIIKPELESCDVGILRSCKCCIDYVLSERQLSFYSLLSNKMSAVELKDSMVSLRQIFRLSTAIHVDFDTHSINEPEGNNFQILQNANDQVEQRIYEFLAHILEVLDRS